MNLSVASSCSVYCGFSLCHIWGEFYFMSQIWFEKSKIIKQAFKCNILAENAPPPHFQLNLLPQQNIYIWTKNTYLLKYKDVSEIKNTFPIYKGTFLLPLNLLCLFECHTFTLGLFHLFFSANEFCYIRRERRGQQLSSLPNISDWIRGWL